MSNQTPAQRYHIEEVAAARQRAIVGVFDSIEELWAEFAEQPKVFGSSLGEMAHASRLALHRAEKQLDGLYGNE